jgi:hypothetical protein
MKYTPRTTFVGGKAPWADYLPKVTGRRNPVELKVTSKALLDDKRVGLSPSSLRVMLALKDEPWQSSSVLTHKFGYTSNAAMAAMSMRLSHLYRIGRLKRREIVEDKHGKDVYIYAIDMGCTYNREFFND